MKILFDVNHAGHVHFIKNAFWALTEEGYDCLITASDKPLVYELLKENNLPYYPMGPIGKSLISKFFRLFLHDIKLLLYCISHRPQLILGIVAIRGSHVGWILGIKSIVFTDSEHARKQIALFQPFANEIQTPKWFHNDLGKKQVRYQGFHELAYLHPNNFTPNDKVLSKLGVQKNQPFYIIRFVSWDATHDINQSGIDLKGKRDIIQLLSKKGKVFITSEYELEQEFKHLELDIPFTLLHDAMFYASMVVSEGATTACEAAILGIPTIYINSISLGYITYLEADFDLIYHFKTQDKVVEKIEQLLDNPNLREEWSKKKEHFISTQNDTSEYIVSLVKNSE